MRDVYCDELAKFADSVRAACPGTSGKATGMVATPPASSLHGFHSECRLKIRSYISVAVVFLAQIVGNPASGDIVVFDEDDPTGAGYYDSSVPVVTAPSQMTLASTSNGGKMIILTNFAFSGTQSGLLEWKSAPSGDWLMFVASPGFQIWDVSSYSNVVIFLNGPQVIAAANLPRVGLES